MFCIFRGVFAFAANIDIHDIRIHYHFVTFFWVLASEPPLVASGPPSAKCCPLAQTSSYATGDVCPTSVFDVILIYFHFVKNFVANGDFGIQRFLLSSFCLELFTSKGKNPKRQRSQEFCSGGESRWRRLESGCSFHLFSNSWKLILNTSKNLSKFVSGRSMASSASFRGRRCPQTFSNDGFAVWLIWLNRLVQYCASIQGCGVGGKISDSNSST